MHTIVTCRFHLMHFTAEHVAYHALFTKYLIHIERLEIILRLIFNKIHESFTQRSLLSLESRMCG